MMFRFSQPPSSSSIDDSEVDDLRPPTSSVDRSGSAVGRQGDGLTEVPVRVVDTRSAFFKVSKFITGLIDPKSGQQYFYERSTGRSRWGRPAKHSESDVSDSEDESSDDIWILLQDFCGRTFEYNQRTCESRWVASTIDARTKEETLRKNSQRPSTLYLIFDAEQDRDYVYDRLTSESSFTYEIPNGAVVASVLEVDRLDDDSETVTEDADDEGSHDDAAEFTESDEELDDRATTSTLSDETYLLEGLTLLRAVHELCVDLEAPFLPEWPQYDTFLAAFTSPSQHWELLVGIHRMMVTRDANEPEMLRDNLSKNGLSRFKRHWLNGLYKTITDWVLRPSPLHRQHASFLVDLLAFIQPKGWVVDETCPFRLQNQRFDSRPVYSQLDPVTRTKIFVALCRWGELTKAIFIQDALREHAELARGQFLGWESSTNSRVLRFPALDTYRLYRELQDSHLICSICSDASSLKAEAESILANEPRTSQISRELWRILYELGFGVGARYMFESANVSETEAPDKSQTEPHSAKLNGFAPTRESAAGFRPVVPMAATSSASVVLPPTNTGVNGQRQGLYFSFMAPQSDDDARSQRLPVQKPGALVFAHIVSPFAWTKRDGLDTAGERQVVAPQPIRPLVEAFNHQDSPGLSGDAGQHNKPDDEGVPPPTTRASIGAVGMNVAEVQLDGGSVIASEALVEERPSMVASEALHNGLAQAESENLADSALSQSFSNDVTSAQRSHAIEAVLSALPVDGTDAVLSEPAVNLTAVVTDLIPAQPVPESIRDTRSDSVDLLDPIAEHDAGSTSRPTSIDQGAERGRFLTQVSDVRFSDEEDDVSDEQPEDGGKDEEDGRLSHLEEAGDDDNQGKKRLKRERRRIRRHRDRGVVNEPAAMTVSAVPATNEGYA